MRKLLHTNRRCEGHRRALAALARGPEGSCHGHHAALRAALLDRERPPQWIEGDSTRKGCDQSPRRGAFVRLRRAHARRVDAEKWAGLRLAWKAPSGKEESSYGSRAVLHSCRPAATRRLGLAARTDTLAHRQPTPGVGFWDQPRVLARARQL